MRRTFGVGPREVLLPAMAGGLVELVPEYAGTALRFTSLGDDDSAPIPRATHRLLQRRLDVVRRARAGRRTGPGRQHVRGDRDDRGRATASRRSATSPRSRADLAFGGPPECPTRPLCLPGLERVYGVHFDEVIELDAGGPLTKQALRSRAVDVALLFSTDPDLAGGRFVELVDDRAPATGGERHPARPPRGARPARARGSPTR